MLDAVDHSPRPARVEERAEAGPRLEVIFAGPSADPARQRAWAILLADPTATAAELGRVLAVPPAELEGRLRATGLREERRYRCDAKGLRAGP